MAYKILLETKHAGSALQWALKPDGSFYKSSNESASFVVTSNDKEKVWTDDFLKQTGHTCRSGYGKPAFLRNDNNWTLKVIG